MPTQIQSLVSPVYESIIDVQANGEVITEAQNINTAVALANRIEFVKQAIPSIADNPEAHCYFEDDFRFVDDGAIAFGTPRIWFGDTPWVATQLAAGTLELSHDSGANARNHGTVKIKSTSGTTGINLRKGSIGDVSGVRIIKLMRAKCHVRFDNNAAPVKFEFGLQASSTAIHNPNTASITMLFDPTLSANWLARTSLTAGASEHLADTLAPVTTTNFMELEIRRTDEADPTFEFYVDGALKITKQQSAGTFFIPAGSQGGNMYVAAQVPVFATNEQIFVDRLSFELDSHDR